MSVNSRGPDTHGNGYQQPTQWVYDLNDEGKPRMNGLNPPKNESDPDRTLADIKDAVRRLSHLSSQELRRVPVLPLGTRLEENAAYLNLAWPERGVLVATGGEVAGPDDWLVPKARVDYGLWNKLRGVDHPPKTV